MSLIHDIYTNVVTYPLVNIIQVFENITHDTGLAIFLTSTLINLALWPVYLQNFINAQKMKYINPELQRIQEKYPLTGIDPQVMLANRTKLLTERKELMERHNIKNGKALLAMVIQIPVFISLYNIIRSVVDNKEVFGVYSFIDPDRIANFSGKALGVAHIGERWNQYSWGFLLPFIIGLLMYIQSIIMYRFKPAKPLPQPRKFVSKNAKKKDPNMPDFGEQLQKSMEINSLYLFPVMYVFINIGVPIGLNLYFLGSVLIGAIRQWLINSYYHKNATQLLESIFESDPYLKKQLASDFDTRELDNQDVINAAEEEVATKVISPKKVKKSTKKKRR